MFNPNFAFAVDDEKAITDKDLEGLEPSKSRMEEIIEFFKESSEKKIPIDPDAAALKFGYKSFEDFVKEYKVLAINRHLKVIGIFTRLYTRDKKKFYLKHIPRLWKLIEYNLNFYSLSELNKWINEFFPKKFRIKPKL